MNFLFNYLAATFFVVFLLSEISITSARKKPHHFDWNEHTAPPNIKEVHGSYPFPKHPFHPHNDTSDGDQHTAPPNITDIHGSYPFPKDPFQPLNDTIDDLPERSERRKRDIRGDILENELQRVIGAYNSEMLSQARSTTNAILSRVANLNAHRNLLAFSFNNLATSGFNDLSSMASKLPVSIQNCYNSYGFKFSDAIVAAKVVAGQCLADKMNETTSIVQGFKTSISDAAANLRDVGEQLGQCRALANLYPFVAGLIAKASCLNIAIFSLRSETVLLPLKFATLMGQAFNSIVTIQSDMTRCGLNILNTILDQSIQSGKAINNCINEQTGNGTLYTGSSGNVINTTAPSPY